MILTFEDIANYIIKQRQFFSNEEMGVYVDNNGDFHCVNNNDSKGMHKVFEFSRNLLDDKGRSHIDNEFDAVGVVLTLLAVTDYIEMLPNHLYNPA